MKVYSFCVNLFVYFLVEWVKSKLRLLRNSYTKAKRAPPSGSSRKNQTKRTVWILEKLQFLAPHIAERSSVSNIDTVSNLVLSLLSS